VNTASPLQILKHGSEESPGCTNSSISPESGPNSARSPPQTIGVPDVEYPGITQSVPPREAVTVPNCVNFPLLLDDDDAPPDDVPPFDEDELPPDDVPPFDADEDGA
jgi:hypothetical protein